MQSRRGRDDGLGHGGIVTPAVELYAYFHGRQARYSVYQFRCINQETARISTQHDTYHSPRTASRRPAHIVPRGSRASCV